MKEQFQIIMDSCGDWSTQFMSSPLVVRIPMTISIDQQEYIDDDNLSQAELLEKIHQSKDCPRSACPSPGQYLDAFLQSEAKRIYVVAASSHLSGSYNSAVVAKEMLENEQTDKEVFICNSYSGSAGLTLLVWKIMLYERMGLAFESVCGKVTEFVKKQQTRFVLEDVTFLQRNGRLSGVKALLIQTLHIFPLLAAKDGVIVQAGQARGAKRAIEELGKQIMEDLKECPKKYLVISHCNALDRAKKTAEYISSMIQNIEIYIVETGGIATLYAGNHGLVVSY